MHQQRKDHQHSRRDQEQICAQIQQFTPCLLYTSAVAAEFQKPVLREVEEETFRQGIPTLRNRVGDRAILRALHFYCENKRVIEEVEALRSGDFETFKEKVIESGQSSFMYNQNVYCLLYTSRCV